MRESPPPGGTFPAPAADAALVSRSGASAGGPHVLVADDDPFATGALVWLLREQGYSVAAVSVGIVDGQPTLDLDYKRDVDAEVDMNVVMTGGGRFVEIQGTGEEATFTDDDLAALIKLAKAGIRELRELQKKALADAWPF